MSTVVTPVGGGSRTRPLRRAVLVSVAALVASTAVIAGSLGLAAHRYLAAKDAATSTVRGRVVQDGIGDSEDVRVRWTDARGRTHVQRFGVYDTGRYRRGATFPVRYDATAADPVGYAADPEGDVRLDDLTVPLGLAVAGCLLLLAGWPLRWWWWRRALARPARPMQARWLLGHQRLVTSTWARLASIDGGDPVVRWQRVMWHPALDAARGPVAVAVHGDLTRRRRVAIELEDGTPLVPIGRLAATEPVAWDLVERDSARVEAADAFILPPGAVREPAAGPWWRRRPVLFAVGGAALGAVGGVLLGGGGVAVVPFIAAGAGVLVHSWAFTGAEPDS